MFRVLLYPVASLLYNKNIEYFKGGNGVERNLIAEAKAAFFDAMCRNNPFYALFQAAYQLLGWPVIVGDNSANVLIQIPDEPIDSVWYNALLANPRVHPDLFPQFQNVMHKIYNPDGNPIQVIPGENQQYPLQVCMTVRVANQMAAQVYFHVPKETVSNEEVLVLELLLRAAAAECIKTHRWKPLDVKRMQHQFRSLLKGDGPEDVLQGQAKDLEHSLRGTHKLLITLLEEDARQEDFIPFYISQLERLSQNILSISYEGNIVTLMGELTQEEYENILRFMRSCSVVIGCSAPFSGSLIQLCTMYQQALLTARLGRHLNPTALFFDFAQLAPLQFFIPAISQYQVETFLHPAIVKMIDFDEAHGTQYLKTIQAYLLSGQNNRKSIQLLSLHQNTLFYRLAKIRELFEIDFQDDRQAQTLLCNILLLEAARPDLLPLLPAEQTAAADTDSP